MTSRASSIAYETVTSAQGTLPLLVPMSEVADHMAPQVGAHYLEKENGGRGVMTSSRSITLARSTSRFLDFSLSTTIRRKASAGLPGSMMACRRCLYSGLPRLRI